jgi:MipA family protein
LLANKLSLNLLNSSNFRFGPVLNYHFGRDDDIEDDVVERMREIDDTVEAGVFGDMVWRDAANPRNRFILGASVLQDIGTRVTAGGPVQRAVVASAHPRIRLAARRRLDLCR